MLVGAVAVCSLAGSCGPGPLAPEDVLGTVRETSRYRYLTAPGDSVDIDWQEGYFDWIAATLDVPSAEQLEYRKYRDRGHLERVTGRRTNGFAEPGTPRFHTIWPRDAHEGVHTLFILHVGHPPALFNEGVAVAHQMDPAANDLVARWNADPVHAIARFRLLRGDVPGLDQLIESPGFFKYRQGLTYPIAGSFVRWLIDVHGLESFKTYARRATFDDGAHRTRSLIRSTYSVSLDSLWSEWTTWVRATGD